MAAFMRAWEAVKRFVANAFGSGVVEPTVPSPVHSPAVQEAPVQKPQGLDCPRCNFRITISVPMLLSGEPIACLSCGLKLTVERDQSQACLNELQKVYKAVQRVEKAKGIKR